MGKSTMGKSRMVSTNIGLIPEENFREIMAYQNGFESYQEMYEAGHRIGNDYDLNPAIKDAFDNYTDDFEKF